MRDATVDILAWWLPLQGGCCQDLRPQEEVHRARAQVDVVADSGPLRERTKIKKSFHLAEGVHRLGREAAFRRFDALAAQPNPGIGPYPLVHPIATTSTDALS